ncbi:MAG: cardiolipin synthase [Gammaproteobacteria bacterium]|nr:cardiolipin synthase [Gammaproteobacteria bacterium]
MWIAFALAQLIVIMRILLRPNRVPASRIAWIAVVAAVPVLGVLGYLLLGETNIGRRNLKAMRHAVLRLPRCAVDDAGSALLPPAPIPPAHAHLFKVGFSVSRFQPVAGNSAELMADSNATIDSMVADIDAATLEVDLLFYIWLPDGSGRKIAEALMRAAARGVICRAMVDGLGSRSLTKSSLWSGMREAGVQTAVALPLGNPLLRPLRGRIDLRNHRKILVIDGYTTYCGSQNCADPEFLVKTKYAPWVDAVVRLQGPIARQNQILFATDWMTYTKEELEVGDAVAPVAGATVIAQVVASGPTQRHSAMAEMFETLIFSAREELVISTPYYVPNESMQDALCAAAYRGVRTVLILPAKNDSREVAAASHSYYAELLEAGVEIREYVGGLLHSKTLTLDGEITLIGSANLDRRSFELNFENNMLIHDERLTCSLRERQQQYIDNSQWVSIEAVSEWSLKRRLWNNTMAMLGPLL